MSDLSELKNLLEAQGRAFEEFKAANDARLRAVETKGYAPSDLVDKVNKANADLNALGKQLNDVQAKANRPGVTGSDGKVLTAEQSEHKAAFAQFLRRGIDTGLRDIERKAMNSQSDPDGGYFVLPEVDRAVDRVASTISAVYRLANVVTVGSNQYQKRVKTSGMSMRRVLEGATGGETTEPRFSNIIIDLFPAEVEPWVNNETLEDSFIDLEADLANEVGISFAEGAGTEFITGNGVAKARGITSYTNVANASFAWGSVGYVASGASGAFAASNPADKLVDLITALKPVYRPGAVLLMSDATLGTARQMKDSSGQYYLWQPDPTGGFGGRILGYPVEIDDNMPVIAANSYSIAFANLKRGYTIAQRGASTLIRDPFTSKGVTKFNFRRRFGGGITNFEAIKLMKFA
jgi:HK97 family phage major capsid protein